MSSILLCESGGTLRASEGGKWAATLLTPGTGSSGVYTAEMLAEYAPKAFRKGMKLWFGHPKEGDGPGDRDPRDQWGVLDEDASVSESGEVEGKIRLLPHWKEVVESLGDQAALSIYAMGESDEDGNVTALLEHVTNSVDIVSYPGREGSGLKQKLEAARASYRPGVTSAQDIKEDKMTIEELAEKFTAFASKFDNFLAEQKVAAEAAAKAEADAKAEKKETGDAVEAAVAAVEAVKAAKLLTSLETPLVEAAKRGEDVAAGIEAAKKVMAEAVEAVKPKKDETTVSTYVHESAVETTDDFSLTFGGRY